MGVKGNQPQLLEDAQLVLQSEIPVSVTTEIDNSHGRVVQRIVEVYDELSEFDAAWAHAQSLIVIFRLGDRDGESFQTVSYYLSSLRADAKTFADGIRGHRDIENGLHWVKDVVFGEDKARFPCFNAATNWSTIRTIVMNLLRLAGYQSVTSGLRFLCHDIEALFSLITQTPLSIFT